MMAELGDRIDLSRVHFVGRVPRGAYLRLLQVSAAHVYLTYPFVLSWSLLEAMAAGCLVVASDTAPVREVVAHGRNGLLVDFFSPAALADAVCGALADPAGHRVLRGAARRTALDRYSLDACLPRQVALAEALASGRLPAPTLYHEAA
jgi:glycosyltransferase involved in cell wall biosynthesis